jgi:hypothetical protein
MIRRLIEALHAAKLDHLSGEEIADLLWLAVQRERGRGASRPELSDMPGGRLGDDQRRDERSIRSTVDDPSAQWKDSSFDAGKEPATSSGGSSRNVYLPDSTDSEDHGSRGFGGIGFPAPGVAALPNQLAIGRSLRPLSLRIPSPVEMVFDIEATVRRIAEERTWIPLRRPATERWLELALVIDESANMVIWRQTVDELQSLLERQGAFRTVTRWGMRADQTLEDELGILPPAFYAGSRYSSGGLPPLRSPQELAHPHNRRLIVLVSDCVALGWRNGQIENLLAQWTGMGTVVLVQVLPENLWPRTGLAQGIQVMLRAAMPGVPNSDLQRQYRWHSGEEELPDGLLLPITTLEPERLSLWARSLVGRGQAWTPGILFPDQKFESSQPIPMASAVSHPDTISEQPDPTDPKEWVERFFAEASAPARILAGYLAVVQLSLPVMRLVQESMMDKVQQVHLAEVFLSDLVVRHPNQSQDRHPDEVLYDFRPGVREILLTTLLKSEIEEVLERTSYFVDRHTGQPLSFQSLLADPSRAGQIQIDERSQPFATVTADVLCFLGGVYAGLGKELARLTADSGWHPEIDTSLAAHDGSTPALSPELTAFDGSTLAPTPELAAFEGLTPAPTPDRSDAMTRDKIEVQPDAPYQPGWEVAKVENFIFNPPPPDPAEKRAADAESAYLRRLRKQSNALPLAQESRGAGDSSQLVNIYVDLQVTAGPDLEQVFQRLSVPNERRSDLRQQLRLWAAQSPREKNPVQTDGGDRDTLDTLRHWAAQSDKDDRKPPLFAYAKHTGEIRAALGRQSALESLAANRRLVLLGHPGSGKSTFVNHLAYICAGARLGEEAGWQATLYNLFPAPPLPLCVIVRRWSSSLTAKDKPGPELIYAGLMEATGLERDALYHRLNQPDTLVLLDGLDEAPAADSNDPTNLDRRRLILKSVDAFCAARPLCRVLVTCRVKPYHQSAYRLSHTPTFTLAELNDPRIERFIRGWYAELARIDPEWAGRARNAEGRLLAALQQRADLRGLASTPMLLNMMVMVNTRSSLPDNRADLYHELVEQLLWEWEAAKSREGGERSGLVDLLQAEGVGLKRGDLERVLWEMAYAAHAQSGTETADLSADMLRAKLAAMHPRRHDGWAWADRVVALIAERNGLLVESEAGIFTFLHRATQEYLAARWLLEQEDCPQQAAALAGSDAWREVVLLACGYATSRSAFNRTQAILFELVAGTAFATEETDRRLLVAGQGWLEFGAHRAVGVIGALLKERMPPLLTRLMQSRDTPPTQRLEAGLILADLNILPDDLDEFIHLSPTETVPYAFKIGKYPVTNAQYGRFVETGGYDADRPWWTSDDIKDIEGWRKGPRLWDDERFNKSTQPVVGVSWYEAVAYCAWLTGELRKVGQIGQNEEARLLTQAEWERASRSNHGREYPWGNEFDPARANTNESKLEQSTPVHMYPDGATPEGVWDLAGNVWEWSANVDTEVDVDFMLWSKGGSWSGPAKMAQSSTSGDTFPPGGAVQRDSTHGFRCVIVPSSR